MDLVNIASYDTVILWTNKMFTLYTQPCAPGFNKVTQAQLLRADRQSCLRLAEMVTDGFKASRAGVLPMDDAFDRLHNGVAVTYHLLPLPQGAAKKEEIKADVRDGPYIKGKGKGKKGRGGAKRFPMPAELQGRHHMTPQRKPICFDFNSGRCSNKSCKREHACCVPNCYKKHPRSEHS